MVIKLMVSEENENTAYPWWVIVDPRQSSWCNPHDIWSMITGPFFSRKEAQDYLNDHQHRFTQRAVVSCCSGYASRQYVEACDAGRCKGPYTIRKIHTMPNVPASITNANPGKDK